MQLNVSYPATGCQKLFEVNDEHKLRVFYEKRMGAQVDADILGDEWKGYVVRIAGGNDKQGFPMKQGVLTHGKLTEKKKCVCKKKTKEPVSSNSRPCSFVVEEEPLMLPSTSYW